MSNCPVCGSSMMSFKNPAREICPTPDRHEASKRAGRDAGRKTGEGNKGRKGGSNLPGKKKK